MKKYQMNKQTKIKKERKKESRKQRNKKKQTNKQTNLKVFNLVTLFKTLYPPKKRENVVLPTP